MSHSATVFRFALFIAICTSAVLVAQEKSTSKDPSAKLYRIDAKTSAGLQDLLQRTDEPLPLVSGHRGGAQQGFPENCIPTFEHTLAHTYAMLEIDPRYTKDGEIVVHHDATLDRTTTGSGKVIDFTLAELKKLRLKDRDGQPTEFPMPTLDEVLIWSRGKTILVLDQKDVPVAARVMKIEQHQAEAHAMLIVNTFKDAQACYALNKNIMMEVMVPNREKFAEFDKLGIPWKNVVAFVGHKPPEDLQLYKLIHAKGACCMIGTSRNLDRQFITQEVKKLSSLEADYRAFLKRGADLIETDIPAPLGALLYRATPIPSAKKAYFHPPVR
ncbi:glycerophosphodiester phosphodiesterase family protein [Anatilimnocola sp. NA78]|uniref:glycerophosphodiester phosphodiesterase family protein n=1 Tax=Anatilimnocola sp. NA78 TaxID=3415683 RepID=UPI003CE56D25